MNIILVLIDSVNRNALSPYGGREFATPNLQAFADRAWRFDNHFVGSLPCMPARREIFSGTMNFQWRPWGPLEPFDLRLPKLLEQGGYSTAIVTDHYHYWEESANGYIQSFQSAEFVRGHELDFWKPLLPENDLPQWVRNVEKWRPGYGRRYYSNVAEFNDETDYFTAKVMSALATLVFGLVVAASGYENGVEVTPVMQNTIWVGFTIVPAVSCLISAVVFGFYRLDRRPQREGGAG